MITLRLVEPTDLDLLAIWNKQLIEDERHDNLMGVPELKERMQGFLQTGYRAYLFEDGREPVGYALVNLTKDPLYLRQFFIARKHRRHGYGRVAFFSVAGDSPNNDD